MKQNNNGNNGHNGYKKEKIKFEYVGLRETTVDKLRINSIKLGMSYSDYIEKLIETNIYNDILNDPQYKQALESLGALDTLLVRLTRKAQERNLSDTGGFKY